MHIHICCICVLIVVCSILLSSTARIDGLKGTLPDEIAGLPLLVEFGAADTDLSGSIPIGLRKVTELIDLYLFNCGISGPLPQDIGNLHKLTHLAIQQNDLSGTFPPSLYALTSLHNMHLRENSFSGSLSSEIGNLVSVKQFELANNEFTGVIPSDVARMTSLGKFLVVLHIPVMRFIMLIPR